MPPRRLNEIVHGERGITADTAIRLARYVGTSKEFWMNLQSNYELRLERRALQDKIAAITPLEGRATVAHSPQASVRYGRPGELALRALTTAKLLDGVVHAHAIGESRLATGARRHLVQERGVPKRNVDFVVYWRHGRPATS